MVPKGEIVNDEQFLLFAQCFLLYNKNRIFLLQIKYRCLLKLPISTDLKRIYGVMAYVLPMFTHMLLLLKKVTLITPTGDGKCNSFEFSNLFSSFHHAVVKAEFEG